MQCKMTANRIYGYLSEKGLKILEQKNMVRGLPKLQDSSNVCSDCMIGKQHREPFLK
ncbi:ubiquitin carboxyl-terminal hydrolase, partial [Trifolium medium]|nr:ubiquitin carboxyl-terminal hydrolase [Trifolium medium]